MKNPVMNPVIERIKWVATGFLIVSVALNSLGVYPLGPLAGIVGGVLWGYAAILMRDKPLIVTNAVMTLVAIAGLLYVWSTS